MPSLPPKIYLVARHFGPRFGFGGDDCTASRDKAYDQFAKAVEDGETVAVIEITTIGSIACGARDVTDEFEHELQEVHVERGLVMPDVRRFRIALP